jgi:hypothetical protein
MPELRAKLAEANRRYGTRPPKAGRPWSAAEDVLVRSLRPPEVVKRPRRTLSAVHAPRYVLGLPDGRAGRVNRRK